MWLLIISWWLECNGGRTRHLAGFLFLWFPWWFYTKHKNLVELSFVVNFGENAFTRGWLGPYEGPNAQRESPSLLEREKKNCLPLCQELWNVIPHFCSSFQRATHWNPRIQGIYICSFRSANPDLFKYHTPITQVQLNCASRHPHPTDVPPRRCDADVNNCCILHACLI